MASKSPVDDPMSSSIELSNPTALEDSKVDIIKGPTTIEIQPSLSPTTEATDQLEAAPFKSGFKGRFQHFKTQRPLLYVCLQTGLVGAAAVVLLVLAVRALLPPFDEDHRGKLHIPKDFQSLKDLNDLLQVYKERHFNRVLACFILCYFFVQAFSLPGSMYLSILSGAMYGLWALPLCCFCVATGASLCYGLSALLGPALLHASAKWRNRIAQWKDRIRGHRSNLISYLIVLRIAPLPPHWVVNIVAPHLSIDLKTFWLSTFLGVVGVTFIHVTIGKTLSEMTSSADFHLISLRNFLVLAGIVVAALFPVIVRYAWKTEIAEAAATQAVGAIVLEPDVIDDSSNEPVHYNDQPKSGQLIFLDDQNKDLPPRTDHSRQTRPRQEIRLARQRR